MPQRRKQQKGAGLLDGFLTSDPAKKIEANNKRIGELENESKQKCDEIKKINDQKIAGLKEKNEGLQKAADAKKAVDAQEASSGSYLSKFKGLFDSKPADAADKPADKPAAKPVEAAPAVAEAPKQDANEEVRPAAPAAGGRLFGGKKSKRRRGSKARKSAKK
jgi:hypothetical protein